MGKSGKPVSIVSPENQAVTFVELFFDLVFVFSVTQVVSFFSHDMHWATAGREILVFWLVWWAWTQFAWALNAADTTHTHVVNAVLAATAVAFLMAIAIPDAFGDHSLWFAAAYVVVRLIGLTLYSWVARENPSLGPALKKFAGLSLAGLAAALVGGFLGGAWQVVLWVGVIVLDFVAASVGGKSVGWNLHADHFTERHGLFVIIALGESLIVAAGGVAGATWTAGLLTVSVLAVALTCGLWWAYFARVKPAMETAFEDLTEREQSEAARDTYSFLHFPIICGVVALAAAVELAVAHPDEPLSFAGRAAVASGLFLFLGGVAFAFLRLHGRFLWPRVLITLITGAAICLLPPVQAPVTLAIALLGVLLVVIVESAGPGEVACDAGPARLGKGIAHD